MNTFYSNLLQFKVTPNELVFEFSSFFPDRPNVGPPADSKPEVRVVMNAGVLDQLVGYLTQVANQRRAATAVAQPKAGLGFVPPGSANQ